MKVKIFYSIIVDVKDEDVLNAYVRNQPGIDYKPEPELTTELSPDLLEIEDSLFEKTAKLCNPNKK